MNIIIRFEDDTSPILTTLEDFLSENSDGFDEREVEAIRSCLSRDGMYHGGGGAGAEWTIKKVDDVG